jgi:hypothetical protein
LGKEDKRRDETDRSTVTVREPQEVEEDAFEGLTPEEERVLRLLRGLSEDESHRLKFALGANEETRLKLAMIEKHLLEVFEAEILDEELLEREGISREELVRQLGTLEE